MRSIRECFHHTDAKGFLRQAGHVAKRFLPVLSWAPQQSRQKATADCIGGFIAGVMLVPTCLSWASLAGLDLSCGLSAALVASLSYGTFGSCGVLSLGPVAEITTLLISISGIPDEKRQATFQSIGVQVGILSVLLSFIDGGKVIKTIFAKPVGDGYTCAAALLAICVQLKTMFNVKTPPATLIQDVLFQTIKALIQQFSIKCIYCFLLFMTYCLYLIYIKKTRLPSWIPHQLIVVVVSTLVTYELGLYKTSSLDLAIVGTIPPGIRAPSFPPWENMIGLGPYTLTITVISFVQMYVIAQRVMPDINPNSELFASGVTNFFCNVFGGMPVTNSFSVSSVLMGQHVYTPLTAYAAAAVLFITMMFLTRLNAFYYLPKQALGAIVVASVWRLVDFSGPMLLWQYSKKDAAVWVVTFVLTIFGGITVGVLGGIALSLIIVVLRIARPRAVTVGFNMSTFHYGDISKDPELLVYPNILLWRFDAPLYFVNTGYLQEKLMKAIRAEVRPIDVVIVTCGKVVDIDAAALSALPTLIESVARVDSERRHRIILCDIHGRLEQVLLASEALSMYIPDEYDRLSIEQIEKSGKFPVVFKRLEDAIAFAQRCISERYGNVDTAPYPNVSFLTDLVVEAAKLQDADGGSALAAAIAVSDMGGNGASAAEQSEEAGVNVVGLRYLGGSDDAVHDDALDSSGAGALTVFTNNRNDTTISLHNSHNGGGFVDRRLGGRHNMNVHLLEALQKLKRLSSYSPDRELIGVMGVIRHTEVTPRQKEKVIFTERGLLQHAFKNDGALKKSRRTREELEDFFRTVEDLLISGTLHHADSWRRVLAVARSQPPGLKMKVKAQPVFSSKEASFSSLDVRQQLLLEPHHVDDVQAARFVIKWGGVPTRSGLAQAHVLGEKLFARFYAAGDLPLRRLLAFTKNPRVYSSDDSRVVATALVVTNAITQSTPVIEDDIIRDDALLKTLSLTAKRLLHDEYKYFEALMHIDSHAAARHYFHIPGFRQLLVIPALDRPIMLNDGNVSVDSDAIGNAGGLSGGASASGPQHSAYGLSGFVDELGSSGGGCGVGLDSARAVRADISFYHGSRAITNQNAFASMRRLQQQPQQQQWQTATLTNRDYYTPLEVMKELEAKMRIIVETELPKHLLNLLLSNHETLREMRQRYGAMLKVFLGAKRNQKASTQAAVARCARGGGSGGSSGQGSPHCSNRGNASYASDRQRKENKVHEDDEYSDNDNGDDEGELQVVGGSSEEEYVEDYDDGGDAAHDSDNSSLSNGDPVIAEIASVQHEREVEDDNHAIADGQQAGEVASGHAEGGSGPDEGLDRTVHFGPSASSFGYGPDTNSGVYDSSTSTHPYSSAIPAAHTRRTLGPDTTSGDANPHSKNDHDSSKYTSRSHQTSQENSETLPPHSDERRKPAVLHSTHSSEVSPAAASTAAERSRSPLKQQQQQQKRPVQRSPDFAPRVTVPARYDLSDISKLRDFGSYDISYNLHILKGLHAATHIPEIRRIIESLVRLARITECMSRVGENVLEGVNSSKRFIIGSLVSGGLLESILRDYTELAKMDERKGVQELLLRAQSLYMTENGGVEQDVQHFVRFFRRIGKSSSPSSSSSSREARAPSGGKKGKGTGAVTSSVDPLRGDEPLMDETPAEREFRLKFPFISLPKEVGVSGGKAGGRRRSRDSNNHKEEKESYTRFYFTTYLHVEGVLQCLFESNAVDGFRWPGKEELEESQQLYMKHLIFKVFRRRNYSFTDAEAMAAFRKLRLLFRSDVDYDRQQRELRVALANLYHCMYYISMEVYLSLGDAEGVGNAADSLDGPLLLLDTEPDAFFGSGGGGTAPTVFMASEDRRSYENTDAYSPSELSSDGEGGEEDDGEEVDELNITKTAASGPGRGATTRTSSFDAALQQQQQQQNSADEPIPTIIMTPSTDAGGASAIAPARSAALSPQLLHSPHTRNNASFFTGSPRAASAAFAGFFLSPPSLGVVGADGMPSPFSDDTSGRGLGPAAVISVGGSPINQSMSPVTASSTIAVPMGGEPSLTSMHLPPKKARKRHHANNKKAATVLTTPEAGRGTAVVQEMKNRVSSVTPMRRIHEGISIDEFLRLVREAESAIRSQQSDD